MLKSKCGSYDPHLLFKTIRYIILAIKPKNYFKRYGNIQGYGNYRHGKRNKDLQK
jgi:hypothetical protein